MTDIIATHPIVATERSESLDAARFVAAIGIVWLHTYIDDFDPRLANVGRFSVPFFMITAVYLQSCSQRRHPAGQFARFALGRCRRLYLPFLFWTLVYYLTANAKRKLLSHQPLLRPDWGLLVAGSSLQLWYLPFLLAVSLVLFPVIRCLRLLPVWPTAVALGIAGAAAGWLPLPWHGTPGLYELPRAIDSVVGLGWMAVPAVCWGVAVSLVKPRFEGQQAPLFAGLCLLLLAVIEVWLVLVDRNIFLENLAGAALFFAAMFLANSPVTHRLSRFGRSAYGIYLIHVLFIEMLFAILPRLHVPNSYPLKLAETICVSLVSLGLVRLIQRSRLTAWTVD